MNEDEYREIYSQVNSQRCIFEKMTLLRYGKCVHCKKLFLAEREAMACKSKASQKNCLLFLNTVRKNSRFALQLTQANEPLSHAKELKVQVGGVFGLQQCLDDNNTADTEILSDDNIRFQTSDNAPIKNIQQTIADALKKFSDIKKFPYTEIVKSVINFKGHVRRNRK